jgi:L-cystine uptake protein TcyP (sodium:dicarboxylate symporter family)
MNAIRSALGGKAAFITIVYIIIMVVFPPVLYAAWSQNVSWSLKLFPGLYLGLICTLTTLVVLTALINRNWDPNRLRKKLNNTITSASTVAFRVAGLLVIYQCVVLLEVVRVGVTTKVAANLLIGLYYLLMMGGTHYLLMHPEPVSERVVATI